MSPKGVNELMSDEVPKSDQSNIKSTGMFANSGAGSRGGVQSDTKVSSGGLFSEQQAAPQELKNYQDTKSDVVRHGHILAKTVEIVESNNARQPDQYPMSADEQAFVAESSAYLEKGFFNITQDKLDDVASSAAAEGDSVSAENGNASAPGTTLGT
jgi:hypothetical protein